MLVESTAACDNKFNHIGNHSSFFLGTGLRYYINGEQSGSGNSSPFMHKTQFSKFRAAKSNSEDSVAAKTLRMQFDQLVIWNRILSPYDIQTAFNDGELKDQASTSSLN